jgi:hypothetical protein
VGAVASRARTLRVGSDVEAAYESGPVAPVERLEGRRSREASL